MEEVHLAVLALTVIAILWADHLGYQYLRGVKTTLDKVLVTRLHYAVWVGLIGMIVTGGIMAYDRWGYLSTLPVFQLKMGFVAVLVINSFFIGALMNRATERSFASLTQTERLQLMASGVLSAVGWIGAASIGLFFL